MTLSSRATLLALGLQIPAYWLENIRHWGPNESFSSWIPADLNVSWMGAGSSQSSA
jgi:hypothetical protein